MIKQFSHVISTIFQPLLMPIYSIALLFLYTHFRFVYIQDFWVIIMPAVVFAFLLPAAFIWMLYKLKIVSDLSLKIRKERLFPYLISLFCYSLMIWFYFRMGMPRWFLMLSAASVAVMLIAILITLWWKISAHMLGIGGLTGGVLAVCYFVEHSNPYYLFILLFVIAGMVGTSRLVLQRHTLGQVIAGFLVGFSLSFQFVWLGM